MSEPSLILDSGRFGECPPGESATILCTCGAEVYDCPARVVSPNRNGWGSAAYEGVCGACGDEVSVVYEFEGDTP